MIDRQGRKINYVRVSVTDRCDLRCVYCMPEQGLKLATQAEILRYEEIVRLVGLLARLGVKKVRLTGGEPLARLGLAGLIEQLKSIEGIERICLTTNGMLLSEQLPELVAAGLDSVNISLDALDEEVFARITRRPGVHRVLASIEAARASGLSVKLNCVPTALNRSQLIPLAERFLADERLPLRFIELMPIGQGRVLERLSSTEVKQMLTERFGELTPLASESLAGPCKYFKLADLPGRLGFIDAVSNCFCASCNRVRLTSTGFLKTCLQFDRGAELKPLLDQDDETILKAMQAAILDKPEQHLFAGQAAGHIEERCMAQIGG